VAVSTKTRNYSIVGDESAAAARKGLAAAEWYSCSIPRSQLKALMKRKDGPAIRDTLIWFASLAASGGVAFEAWGTWWALPAFFVYARSTRRLRILAGTNAAIALLSKPRG
jgi:fatty acid desaturase